MCATTTLPASGNAPTSGSDEAVVTPRLLLRWSGEVNAVLSWALANPQTYGTPRPWLNVHAFAVHAIGDVGDLAAVELLRPYLLDPDVAEGAARSIRRIHERHGT